MRDFNFHSVSFVDGNTDCLLREKNALSFLLITEDHLRDEDGEKNGR
jgi:hypothetical protein